MNDEARWYHRVAGRLLAPIARLVQTALATVTAVDVGRADDGLERLGRTAGTDLDKSWGTLQGELKDALTVWRKNPLARRLIGIVTAYVVGGVGFKLKAPGRKTLQKFLDDFAHHPENRLALRQSDWCDELSRSGELFPTLHTNVADGMSYVRAVPASRIEGIEWMPGDIEAETVYHEVTDSPAEKGREWHHPRTQTIDPSMRDGTEIPPAMLHYAVNRPVGCVRGESDLASILPWLKRYSRWLEDRVRVNAGLRAFLWIVKVPQRLLEAKRKQYKDAPPPGSVMVINKDLEEWEAVTPDIKAGDVKADGRALRWMVAAGGPGVSLLDFGESETSNLASSRTLGEQRRRFLRRRQALFGYILADIAVYAWNRRVALGFRGTPITHADITVEQPDIAPEDNQRLANAAHVITRTVAELQNLVGVSEDLKTLALKLMLKFAGEGVSDVEFKNIVGGTMIEPEGVERRDPAINVDEEE